MDARLRSAAYRDLFTAIARSEQSPAAFIVPNLEDARYRLGTSIADFTLPYQLDERFIATMVTALRELANLWVTRHRAVVGEATFDGVLLGNDNITGKLRPLAYGPPKGLQNPVIVSALSRAPRILLSLDSGMLASWIGSDGRGRVLISEWGAMLAQAADEMDGTAEETVYYLSLILVHHYQLAHRIVTGFDIDSGHQRQLGAVLLLGLALVHHIVRAQIRSERARLFGVGQRSSVLWNALCSSRLAFASMPDSYSLCTPHPVRGGVLGPLGDQLYAHLAKTGDLDHIRGQLQHAMSKGEARTEAIRQYAGHAVREQCFDTLASGIAATTEGAKLLISWVSRPARFETMAADKKARKEAATLLSAEADRHAQWPPVARGLTRLGEWVARYQAKAPLKSLGLDPAKVTAELVESLVAELGDRFMAYQTGVFKRLSPRRGQETDRDLEAQYESGRLYRFGVSIAPALKTYEAAQQMGHYFIDLKDFTRRTALLKEDVMAEFLRRDFYEPILNIARQHFSGAEYLDDRGGVYLNNLLGDAVSISGDIVALVKITRQIRAHLELYADQLHARAQRGDLAARSSFIRQSYDEQLEELERRRAAAQAEQSGDADAQSQARARRETDRLAGLAEALRDSLNNDLAAVTGQHLISGSFISYGAAPTVILMKDPVWHEQKVSICEKINESARGTARVNAVAARLEALLESHRNQRHNPALELPFRVYLSSPQGLSLDAAADLTLEAALRTGDLAAAEAVYAGAAKKHIAKLVEDDKRKQVSAALHNAGDALSGEALAAYRKARSEIRYFDVSVPLFQLDESLTARYLFFDDPVQLAVGVGQNGAVVELFHLAGKIIFKGFESTSATEVWEIMDLESMAGGALSRSSAVAGRLQ